MRRSNALLVSNILATVWAAYLVVVFGGLIIKAGGADFIDAVGAYFRLAFALLGTSSPEINFLYAVIVLLCVHIVVFVLGALIGWMAYAGRKSGGAKFAATLYLIGTVCFPLYLIFGLPITIVGFVGGSKQKKLNKAVTAA